MKDRGFVIGTTAEEIESLMIAEKNEEQRKVLSYFFKTGEGQYGEGDEFLGLKVPQTRAIVKEAKHLLSLEEIEKLLYSKWHEVRLAGFLLLVEEMKANLPRKVSKQRLPVNKTLKNKGNSSKEEKELEIEEINKSREERRGEIAEFYLRHARQANNWDLVDLSCEYVIGPYIRLSQTPDYGILYRLAKSDNLWEQRIAVVTTFDFIRNGVYEPTLKVSDMLLQHPHDLIHKAVGWMLREIGKRDKDVLLDYLEKNYQKMPRTALRYAIEKFDEQERQFWLRRK